MDKHIFERLLRTHYAELLRYARYIGAGSSVAEDIVQEAFLAALKDSNLPPVGNPGRVAAWLRRVARNKFIDYCRKQKNNRVAYDHDVLQQAESVWINEYLRGDDGSDFLEALRGCIEKLPARDRKIVDQRYNKELSRSRIAQMHRMTEDGIKSLLRRIRTSLKKCIELTVGGRDA